LSAVRLQRASTLAMTVACCILALAGPALGHIELERSEPEAGATLDAAPEEVFLRFNGDVEQGSFTITVRDPDGERVTDGDTESGGRAAAVDLIELTTDGVYRVRYTGVAADGHAVDGRLRFRLELAADPAADPTEAPSPTEAPALSTEPPAPAGTTAPTAPEPDPAVQRTTVPWWPFALLLGVAALVGVTLLRRR
jgi:copper resistance protein C